MRLSPLVSHAVAVGDKRRFVSCLLAPKTVLVSSKNKNRLCSKTCCGSKKLIRNCIRERFILTVRVDPTPKRNLVGGER